MKITCLGASGCVTGSCFLIDNGEKFLVDCGLFQGGRRMEEFNHEPWAFDPREISALFLTHAHIDHSGRIPKLIKDGFKGKIYTTLPTAELCKILLLDSAHIQEMEAEWQSRKNARRGLAPVEPLYTQADAEAAVPLFEAVDREQVLTVSSRLNVRFRNAGHILGSSILEMWDESVEPHRKVVFSGDLGRKHQLIIKDPESIFEADTLFIESTYGNRMHRSFEDSRKELVEAIHYSHGHGQKVLIPAFAVERTQEVLYILGELFRSREIPDMPVYLDSPLAIAATEIFRKMESFYDQETRELVNRGVHPFDFPQLVATPLTEDSIAINQRSGPAIVIAGNGMCTAGRIKHHLKHNLWKRGSSLVIVGYQADGSVGRRILNGAKMVKIFGEKVAVRARVFTIGGFSAHADQKDLLHWLSHFRNPRMKVVVIHGERQVAHAFAKQVLEQFGFPVKVPEIGEVIEPFAPAAGVQAEQESDWRASLEAVERRLQRLQALGKGHGPEDDERRQAIARQLREVESMLAAVEKSLR